MVDSIGKRTFLDAAWADLVGTYSGICGDPESYIHLDQEAFRKYVLRTQRLDINSPYMRYGAQHTENAKSWLTGFLAGGVNCPQQSAYWQQQGAESGSEDVSEERRPTLEMAVPDVDKQARHLDSQVSGMPPAPQPDSPATAQPPAAAAVLSPPEVQSALEETAAHIGSAPEPGPMTQQFPAVIPGTLPRWSAPPGPLPFPARPPALPPPPQGPRPLHAPPPIPRPQAAPPAPVSPPPAPAAPPAPTLSPPRVIRLLAEPPAATPPPAAPPAPPAAPPAPPPAAPAQPPPPPPAQLRPSINVAALFDVPQIPILSSKEQILEIFRTANDETQLYAAWGDFRIHYLKAMSEIVDRLIFTDPISGDQHPLGDVFSADRKTRKDARSQIEAISEETEKFAGEILIKAISAFADRLSVPDRALFMAELSLIENLRQKALELGRDLDPRNGISDQVLIDHIADFQNAWATVNNPAVWSEAVLSGMRTYVSEQRGLWNWLAKSSRLWRLEKIKVAQNGNLASIPFHRKMLFMGIVDRLFTEASKRNFTGLNVEINWDGENSALIIYSKNDSFGDLNENASFNELIRQLGGTLEQSGNVRSQFSPWRRWRIPFDSSQSSSTPSIPPLDGSPSLGGAPQGSAGSAPEGMGAAGNLGLLRMWTVEPITAADEPITAYDPNEEIEAVDESDLDADSVTDTTEDGIDQLFGIAPEYFAWGEAACFGAP